ncbi:hypothetical protein [Bacillus sp. S/N-304-OC-R1]|uniref:hypothetical protein n=1 Tax=Bacillus sp. S/N-304-OC-R1 TaxID=2758034 RepID=UPI001C8ED29A|nr:hypothetical protein [Bacillus sp. S/N-304-OC-R1]MBY0121671.1 hypothetical protein [Bacillus sp. S/N-304-OC-R1]
MFFKPTSIQIDSFKVNNLDHLGAISFGSTQKIGRNVNGKKTQGFGQQHGDNTIRAFNWHYVLDEDISDQASVKINK